MKRKPPAWFEEELRAISPALRVLFHPRKGLWGIYRIYDPEFDSRTCAIKLMRVFEIDGIPYFKSRPALKFLGWIHDGKGGYAAPDRNILRQLREQKMGLYWEKIDKDEEERERAERNVIEEAGRDYGKTLFNHATKMTFDMGG